MSSSFRTSSEKRMIDTELIIDSQLLLTQSVIGRQRWTALLAAASTNELEDSVDMVQDDERRRQEWMLLVFHDVMVPLETPNLIRDGARFGVNVTESKHSCLTHVQSGSDHPSAGRPSRFD